MPPTPDAPSRHSGGSLTGDFATWARSLTGRIIRAWRGLPRERRLAALASVALFVVLFLPWYQETVVVPGTKSASAATASVTGWGHFSFVEAAVLLVSAAVLTLLFQRAEGRAFHVPGGDGAVILAGGVWTCALVAWQMFDKPSASVHGGGASISGIEWGIFATLAAAGLLAYSGSRIRSAHRPEPPLPGELDPRGGGGIALSGPDRPEPVRSDARGDGGGSAGPDRPGRLVTGRGAAPRGARAERPRPPATGMAHRPSAPAARQRAADDPARARRGDAVGPRAGYGWARNWNVKYALIRPMITIPAMISICERTMWPAVPRTTPTMRTVRNVPYGMFVVSASGHTMA